MPQKRLYGKDFRTAFDITRGLLMERIESFGLSAIFEKPRNEGSEVDPRTARQPKTREDEGCLMPCICIENGSEIDVAWVWSRGT
jgi:hypothetical protein